jgi:hypothetical protein
LINTHRAGSGTELACYAQAGSVITVGSGCAAPVAKLAEIAFATAGAKLTRTCTPFEVLTSGFRPDLACLISAKGDHVDILDCFAFLTGQAVPMIIVTLSPTSELARRARTVSSLAQLIYPDTSLESRDNGFIPVLPTLALSSLVAFLFNDLTGARFSLEDIFTTEGLRDCDHLQTTDPEWKGHLTILCTKWAEAGARDLETRMMESGLIPPTVCDPWNFGHGRYMPIATGASRAVLMSVPEDRPGIKIIRQQLPSKMLLADVVAPQGGLWGGIYCIVWSMGFIGRLAALHGIDPAVPAVPPWGDAFYNRGRYVTDNDERSS